MITTAREGRYCGQCTDGYGPTVFSDGATCIDCSKHGYLWILNLAFLNKLFMVTILGLLLILFQIKGTSSPSNVIIIRGGGTRGAGGGQLPPQC